MGTFSHTPYGCLKKMLSQQIWIHHRVLGTFSPTPYSVSKFAGITFSSDLRKLTAVSKSLSLSNNHISYYREDILHIETNRMRILHLQLQLYVLFGMWSLLLVLLEYESEWQDSCPEDL